MGAHPRMLFTTWQARLPSMIALWGSLPTIRSSIDMSLIFSAKRFWSLRNSEVEQGRSDRADRIDQSNTADRAGPIGRVLHRGKARAVCCSSCPRGCRSAG